MATIRGAILALSAMLLLGAVSSAADDDVLRAKALKLNSVTGDEPETAKIRELLKDADGTKKLLVVATTMAKEKEQPFNVNATFILGSAAHFLKQYETAERFYRLNLNQALKLQSGKKIGLAYTGLSQMLFENKKYAESQKVCQELMELEADDALAKELERYTAMAMRRMVLCMVRQNEVDKAKAFVERQIKANPDNLALLEFKAQMLREADDLEGATKVYDTLLDRVKKDERFTKEEKEELSADFMYALSNLYIDLNKIDKAEELLQTLLDKEPDNPTFNNDLGYVWADHNKKLDEAEKLIRKAIDEDRKLRKKDRNLVPEDDKDNASYLDSLGWVLFKKKQYKEAKEELQKAVKDEDGQHQEIYDHLGDTYWALGEKKEAIEAWKKAVESARESKREQAKKAEIQKKIDEKK